MGDMTGAYRCLVMRPEDYLEDLGVDGRLILQWILQKWDGGTDWMAVSQDRDSWGAVVNAVMNLRVP